MKRALFHRGWAVAASLLAVSLAGAAPVPWDDVAEAAKGWLVLMGETPLEQKVSGEWSGFETILDEQGLPLCHLFYLSEGGLLVLSPDDEIEPVIAFSSSSISKTESLPGDPFREMLERDMSARLLAVKAGQTTGEGGKQAKWILLQAAARDPERVKAGLSWVSDLRVAPLVQSRWSQQTVSVNGTPKAVYNFYTPKYASGSPNNYPCGCIPTAIAQLMRYHQHPTTAVGTRSFPISVDGVKTYRSLRGGDGSGGPYKWWAMPLNPQASGNQLTDAQRKAIGALTHDVGVASQAQYSRYATSAYLCWSAGYHPLQTVFRYANVESPWVNTWESYSKATINQALNPNLDARLPCAITVNGRDGGHAVLVDGYGYAAGTLYHHLNFGWAGQADAWYNLPSEVQTKYSAYLVIGMLFNLHPTQSGFHIISGRVLGLNGKPLGGVKVAARNTGTGIAYSSRTNERGIYAILVPRFASYEVKAKADGLGFMPRARAVTVGTTVARNVWGANYRAVTRVMALSDTSLAFGPVPVG
jgi:hypothetical protein